MNTAIKGLRSRSISVRFQAIQALAIDRAAEQSGLTTAEFIRRVIREQMDSESMDTPILDRLDLIRADVDRIASTIARVEKQLSEFE
jgi:ferritin